MTFDAAVPAKLKRTQKWFASIITRPIDSDSRMNPISPAGEPMEEEACEFIRPSPTLRPAQRIELYNQQYWWRLLTVMQENFPFLVRLFGYADFNQAISFPYLTKYPSDHWSLNRLGEKLLQWIDEEYHAPDRELIATAAAIDWAYCNSFAAAAETPISPENLPVPGDIESLLTARLTLQPHIALFQLGGDYFDLRNEMIAQPVEHWVDNDFPALKSEEKKYYFILFRNAKTELVWNKLSEAQYALLSRFQRGSSVEECCDWLAKQRKKTFQGAQEHIQQWFKEWVSRRWLILDRPQHARKTRKK